MNTIIEKIIYPGKSLCRRAGQVILTDQGLPEEEVEIQLTRENKDYCQAKTIRVLTASPQRSLQRCEHYQACSAYQYINYPFQVKIKIEQIKEIFLRQLKSEPEKITSRTPNQIWHYRNKIELQLEWEGPRAHLAYNVPGSHDQFIRIDQCFLASRGINCFLEKLREIIENKKLDFISKITVKENSSGNQLLLAVYCRQAKNMQRQLKPLVDLSKQFPLKGIVWIEQARLLQHTLYGNNFIQQDLDNTVFHIGCGSFFQVNIPMLKTMLKDLKQALAPKPNQILADLYCGVGTFGIIFAPLVAGVIGVESAKENLGFLRKNIELNRVKNFTVYKGTCQQWIAPLAKQSWDILIVDPPRQGLEAVVCKSILRNSPPKIAYISCNPTTLARDLKILLCAYGIESVFFYDFFPHTPHIEMLVILRLNR